MIALNINKQKMYYAIPNGRTPIYQKDEEGNIVYYTDSEGNQIPIETGETEISYTTPKMFRGCVCSQLEDAITRAWGSDNSNNFAVLVLSKKAKDEDGNLIDFPNGTVIWRKYDVTSGVSNADYIVDGVMDEELNETSYYLRKRK